MKGITGNPALDAYNRMAISPVGGARPVHKPEAQAPSTRGDNQAAQVTISSRARDLATEAAGQGIAAIHARYVFPTMKLTWGSHPNNVGHRDFPGCFRCHDDKHRSADGRVVTQDCESCHAVLALEEEDPKILTDLGLR